MNTRKKIALLVVVLAVVLALKFGPRTNIPHHLTGHPVSFTRNLLTEQAAKDLRETIFHMKDFPSNANDLKFYKTLREHIGEAIPIAPDGSCAHLYMVPSVNRTHCVLPGRIDVARHFFTHGGVEGFKEAFDVLASRIQSFGRYMFNPEDYPAVTELFKTPKFQKEAKNTCPPHAQVLDPFQFNFIIQVPGQTVALHLDAPYFWGASRFQFPQWLLASMVFSGLFQDKFIHQVQVVAYLHEWTDVAARGGGEFVYWADPDLHHETVPAEPRAGSSVDGSKVVHAAMVYQPHVRPPLFDKNKSNVLSHLGGDNWAVTSDGVILRNYTTNDLRISVVYRARCFASEDEVKRYRESTDFMSLEHILSVFSADLVARGAVTSDRLASMSRLDLGLLILDTYIKYPLPLASKAILPYNYCMLARVLPATQAFLRYIC